MRDIGKEGKIKNFFARQNSIFKRGVTQKDIKFKKEHDRYSNTIIYYWEYFIKKVKCVSRLSRLQGKNPVLQQVK